MTSTSSEANIREIGSVDSADIFDDIDINDNQQSSPESFDDQKQHDYAALTPKVAKVSMLYGDSLPKQYSRGLESHRRHNKRFGYEMHILRKDALGESWNKPTYLLSLIMQELQKPEFERVEWFMWFDADTVLLNSLIPLGTFLPPEDPYEDIHFIGGRDHYGLNTGTFFIRVSAWSIHMLTKAPALPLLQPDVDLGDNMDQGAMAKVIADEFETDPDNAQPAPFVFQPRIWTNAHQIAGGIEGGELEDGYLLLHFPGLEENRWKLMDKSLDDVEKTPEKFEIGLSKSIYAIQVREYWNLARKIQRVVQDAWGVQRGFRDNIRADEEVKIRQALLADPRYDKLWPGDDMLQLMREHVDALESTAQNQIDGYHGEHP